MNIELKNSSHYPFNHDGPLCPLLNSAELLSAFYAEESLRHGLKNFCKKTNWPGKPAVSFAIDPAKLQELTLSLFNSPGARVTLRRFADSDRATYLDNAIWQWLTVNNPKLAERLSGCCDDKKGMLYLKTEALRQLLAAIKQEQPDTSVVSQLAIIVLGFAMLQPDDRYVFGEAFLSTFPEYANKF